MDNSALANRMKEYYEAIPKTRLMRRTPVAIRLDGKAFHTFTRGFERPFDELLILTMQETMMYLCENIQGCVFGFTQSDEITLILLDYQTLTTDAWFNYEVQKMCSISASMATMAFNKLFLNNFLKWRKTHDDEKLDEIYTDAYIKGAMFDARCFNIPKEEVTNLIYWRQLDASRNSVQMVGQAYFSHQELQNKTCSDIQDMLMERHGINWNNFPTYQKRGSCYYKRTMKEPVVEKQEFGEPNMLEQVYTTWVLDLDIPLFKGKGRDYIEKLIWIGE